MCSHHRSTCRARCPIARRPVPAGSSATSASGASHTPQSASVPTLNCRRHVVVARSQHDQLFGSQRRKAIAERAGQQAAGQPEQQTDLGVGGLAVLGDIERHGVLVAVDEHQPDVTDVIAQARDDAQQRRAVAAVDEREPARAVTAGPTRSLRASVIASSAASLIRLVDDTARRISERAGRGRRCRPRGDGRRRRAARRRAARSPPAPDSRSARSRRTEHPINSISAITCIMRQSAISAR